MWVDLLLPCTVDSEPSGRESCTRAVSEAEWYVCGDWLENELLSCHGDRLILAARLINYEVENREPQVTPGSELLG